MGRDGIIKNRKKEKQINRARASYIYIYIIIHCTPFNLSSRIWSSDSISEMAT